MKDRKRNNRNSGFTLVEVLATAGILVILLAIAMVGVIRYIDVLKIAELDNAAREIYMAAENRAVLLSGAQRLDGLVPTGNDHKVNTAASSALPYDATGESGETGNLYYVSKADLATGTAKDLLADGSIDPALWDGDFYIVYDMTSGSVRDVFYAEKDKNAGKAEAAGPSETEESKTDGFTGPLGALIKKNGFDTFYQKWTQNRSTRLDLKKDETLNPNQTLVGWYSGKAAQGTSKETDIQEKPYIDVMIKNEEELTVTVTVKWDKSIDVAVREAITNKDPNHKTLSVELGKIDLVTEYPDGHSRNRGGADPGVGQYVYSRTWVLDSLADDGLKFDEFKKIDSNITPGADFTVTAKIEPFSTAIIKYSFIAAKATATNNSLFEFWTQGDSWEKGKGSDGKVAHIAYLRHLQNLSTDNGYDSGVGTTKTEAVQTADIWGDGNGGGTSGGNHQPYVAKDKTGGTLADYSNYQFVPIVNDELTSYKGINGAEQYEIRNLNLKAASNGASVGLFSTVSKGSKAKMDLLNIHLVNTTMTGTGGTVGALAGTATDTTITGCWVYWDDDDVSKLTEGPGDVVKGTTNADKYQLVGNVAGGLVGEVSGTTKISNSLAATLIQGTDSNSSVGGLVGKWSGNSDASSDITHSYADCYLTGTGNVAGLVGEVASGKTVWLKDCYAAGFIMGAGKTGNKEQAAGLSMGTGATTADHVYSVMLRAETDAATNKTTYKVPEHPLTAGSLTDKGETHFMGGGEVTAAGNKKIQGTPYATMSTPKAATAPAGTQDFADTMGTDAFEWKNTADKNDSHPYNRQHDPSNADSKKLKKYVYPGLKDLPHYDDWGELSASIKPIGLIYFEDYNAATDTTKDTDWGFSYGYEYKEGKITGKITKDPLTKEGTPNNLALAAENSGKVANYDGYAMAFWASGDAYKQTKVKYRYDGKMNTDGSWPTISVDDVVKTGITRDGGETLFLFPLPVQGLTADPGIFYHKLEISVENGGEEYKGTVYFNPHFGDSVLTVPEGENAPTGFPDPIKVRSARHLYNLGAKYGDTGTVYYNAERTYNQLLNVDYTNYIGYSGSFDEETIQISNTESYKFTFRITGPQKPIGPSSDIPFSGTYDGRRHTISGLSIENKKETKDNKGNITITYPLDLQGLFGRVTSGTIENVTVESGSVVGKNETGGIVGYNHSGTVSNCVYSGTVTGKGYHVGGVVGYNWGGTVRGCGNTRKVTGEDTHVGGVVGYNNIDGSLVEYCWNTGDVINEFNKTYVGGVVGFNQNGARTEHCWNSGTVDAKGQRIGGVVGNNVDNSGMSYCYNTGTVKGLNYVGGVVGFNSYTVENCYNTGGVSGGSYVGGVAGSGGTMNYCYNTGTVKCTGTATTVGGVAGYNGTNVKNCYYLKGMLMNRNDTVMNDKGIGSGTDNTTKLDLDQFAEPATFTDKGWNFNDDWVMVPNMPLWTYEEKDGEWGPQSVEPMTRPVLLDEKVKEAAIAQNGNSSWSIYFSGLSGKLTEVTGHEVVDVQPDSVSEADRPTKDNFTVSFDNDNSRLVIALADEFANKGIESVKLTVKLTKTDGTEEKKEIELTATLKFTPRSEPGQTDEWNPAIMPVEPEISGSGREAES